MATFNPSAYERNRLFGAVMVRLTRIADIKAIRHRGRLVTVYTTTDGRVYAAQGRHSVVVDRVNAVPADEAVA